MALAVTYSRANRGIAARPVAVETHLSGGLPRISIVGLPETTVKESKDRVRSALLNMKFHFPAARLTINLAPADLPKEGGRFDLAIAVGILLATRQIPPDTTAPYEFIGELALSGDLRPVPGILPAALAAKRDGKAIIVPWENREEAALVRDLDIFPAKHLLEVCAHLQGKQLLGKMPTQPQPDIPETTAPDLCHIRGQKQAKRALIVAAAGKHSMLLIGSPGGGKTMLVDCLPGLLPPMSEQETLQSAMIASVSSTGFNPRTWRHRPFRRPHHSASAVALVGGGTPPKPGEISLAHGGVLFLDELPEFSRQVLETLREPLESGNIVISRAGWQTEFPADFQLMAAMNPCPCGYLNDPTHTCRCSAEQIGRYHHRLSGPLLDRIDMHLQVPRLPLHTLTQNNHEDNETSTAMRQRVGKAHDRQLQRAGKANAKLTAEELERHCRLNDRERRFLRDHGEKLKLSARAYHRILRVARTIADLAYDDTVTLQHLGEALHYRAPAVEH